MTVVGRAAIDRLARKLAKYTRIPRKQIVGEPYCSASGDPTPVVTFPALSVVSPHLAGMHFYCVMCHDLRLSSLFIPDKWEGSKVQELYEQGESYLRHNEDYRLALMADGLSLIVSNCGLRARQIQLDPASFDGGFFVATSRGLMKTMEVKSFLFEECRELRALTSE